LKYQFEFLNVLIQQKGVALNEVIPLPRPLTKEETKAKQKKRFEKSNRQYVEIITQTHQSRLPDTNHRRMTKLNTKDKKFNGRQSRPLVTRLTAGDKIHHQRQNLNTDTKT
jgi:hypothetical protein